MITLARHLTAMAYNNGWANHRLHGAVAKLGEGELAAPRVGFFPSLRATLNHIVTVDWMYVDALERALDGRPPEPRIARFFEPEEPFHDRAALRAAQREVDLRLVRVCAGLDEAALATRVGIVREKGVVFDPAHRLLAHLFQHQIHHRGQAHAMLSGTTVAPLSSTSSSARTTRACGPPTWPSSGGPKSSSGPAEPPLVGSGANARDDAIARFDPLPSAAMRLLPATRAAALGLALGAAIACQSQTQGGPGSSSSPAGTSPPPPTSAAPGSRAAIRDNAAKSPPSSGVSLEARALVSQVALGDGLTLALRFVREQPPGGPDPWDAQTLDGAAALSSLRFEVELPGGAKRTLEVDPAADAKPSPISPRWWMPVVTLDETGLTVGDVRRSWKAKADDVFAATGTIGVAVTATFATNTPPVTLTTGRIALDVVTPSPAFQRLVDLERAASAAARAAWGTHAIPIPRDPTVDDVDGNLAVRFQRPSTGGGRTGYDDELLEVWVDRAGKVLATDGYVHFTCVAEGTPIATPAGPIAVERLAIGAEVLALDVEAGAATTAKVLRIERDRAPEVVAIGDLLVTPGHPIWADGRWTPAREIEPGASLLGSRSSARAPMPAVLPSAHVVYDVGVTAPHTYFAGGVLVHNKAVHVPLGGAGRPWGPLFFRHAAK